ncbi:MAG: biopolymer transporter ExbD [Pseudomonadota bacterium]
MNPDLDLFEEPELGIDLTPLIDVIFMLLIFFILAGSLAPPSIKVDLPQAASAEQPPRREAPLRLTIDQQGRIHQGRQLLTPEQLPGLLAAAPRRPVEVEVDSRAPFAPFMRVLDQARLEGREDLRIVARPPQQP